MKYFILVLATVILMTVSIVAKAGGLVGNGGGAVVCKNMAGEIGSIELLDYYEARALYKFELVVPSHKVEGTYKDHVRYQIERLAKFSELRQKLYSQWIETFEKESNFLYGVEFGEVPDARFIALPKNCAYAQAVIQRKPMFTSDFRYFINGDLWAVMTEEQKAGLVMHEFFYREALGYGHTDSTRARYLNGVFASNNFDLLTSDAWRNLLVEARFELFDYPIAHPLKLIIEPSKIWRPGPSDHFDRLELYGRNVVQVGECKDEGCTTFEESNHIGLSSEYLARAEYLGASYEPHGPKYLDDKNMVSHMIIYSADTPVERIMRIISNDGMILVYKTTMVQPDFAAESIEVRLPLGSDTPARYSGEFYRYQSKYLLFMSDDQEENPPTLRVDYGDDFIPQTIYSSERQKPNLSKYSGLSLKMERDSDSSDPEQMLFLPAMLLPYEKCGSPHFVKLRADGSPIDGFYFHKLLVRVSEFLPSNRPMYECSSETAYCLFPQYDEHHVLISLMTYPNDCLPDDASIPSEKYGSFFYNSLSQRIEGLASVHNGPDQDVKIVEGRFLEHITLARDQKLKTKSGEEKTFKQWSTVYLDRNGLITKWSEQ